MDKTNIKNTSSDLTNRIIKIMWGGFFATFFIGAIFFMLLWNGCGNMPDVEELENPKGKQASVILSEDGEEMGRFFENRHNRVYVGFDDVSPHLIDALIATEDARFLDHSGIDFIALARAVVKTGILRQKSAGGGSTITQQLAKQLFTDQAETGIQRLLQKPGEWVIAVKLERNFTKEEIIKMYLNQFDFLNNAVGIKSAAYVYFGKEPKDLSIQESAMLVGMLKNPSYFNPIRHPDRVRDRRNVVLQQMYKENKISRAECEQLQQLPLGLNYHKVDHKDGLAPYFREELRRIMTAKHPERNSDRYKFDPMKYVEDSIQWANNPLFGWVEKNRKRDGEKYNIYTDGLRIYTTINSDMQRYAEAAVTEHMKQLQNSFFREKRGSSIAPYSTHGGEITKADRDRFINRAKKQSERYRVLHSAGWSEEEINRSFNQRVDMRVFTYSGAVDTVMTPMDSIVYTKFFLRTGMMSMDPTNGYVKAYVGGPNFKFFQYDMVSTGRRQIGSTVKPFLYTLAMEEGYTPCDVMQNVQPHIQLPDGTVWSPKGSGGNAGAMMSLKEGLTRSSNWMSAHVMEHLAPQSLVRMMRSFGITSQLDAVPSLCLGPCEVSLKQMVTAYTAFANKGMRSDPVFVTRIEDSDGNVLAEFSPSQSEVISEAGYYKILDILRNVVNDGTGRRLRYKYGLNEDFGGKTGTTNLNADGWFIGFTPQLVTGVWVGGEERYIHFNSTAEGQGSAMALPIFALYMQRIYKNASLHINPNAQFVIPPEFNPCGSGFGEAVEEEEPIEAVEGIFD